MTPRIQTLTESLIPNITVTLLQVNLFDIRHITEMLWLQKIAEISRLEKIKKRHETIIKYSNNYARQSRSTTTPMAWTRIHVDCLLILTQCTEREKKQRQTTTTLSPIDNINEDLRQ